MGLSWAVACGDGGGGVSLAGALLGGSNLLLRGGEARGTRYARAVVEELVKKLVEKLVEPATGS